MKIQRFLATALTAITIVSITTTAFATEVTPQRLDRTTIKVGYLENYGIVNAPSVRGSEGYGYEYLEEVEKYTNYHFEYISTGWVEGFEMLERGEIDLFGTASMNEERKERVEFVETPILYESACIYAPMDLELYYGDPTGLKGLTIGVSQGAVYCDALEAYIAEHNLDLNIKFTEHTNFEQYIKDGEIDIFLAGSIYQIEGTKIIEELYSEPLYFISTKGNETLCDNLEDAITKIEENEPYFNELLWAKYYDDTKKAVQYITKEEKAALEQKEVYTVGFHADLHPISYVSHTGEYKGFALDVMNILAEKLDIKITYIPIHCGQASHAEDVDFNLCPLNDDCAAHGTLSEPYDKQDLLVVRDPDVRKRDVQNILVQDFSTIKIEDFLHLYPSATVHKSYSSADSLRIYEAIAPDCKIIPEGSEKLIWDRMDKNISVLDVNLPIGILVSDNLPDEVLLALNKSIFALKDSTVDELILESVLVLEPQPTALDVLIEYQYLIATVFLLIVGTFVFVLWKSRKRVTKILEVDTLTNVMTRYKFSQVAERLLAKAEPNEYMLILLDVDNFKGINKRYGIEMGNKLLCAVVKSMNKRSKSDALVGRIQNDVFAIITKTTDIPRIQLDKDLEQAIVDMGIDIAVYFSVGVCVIENPKESIAYLLDNARTAKQLGKAVFGNTVNYFTKAVQVKNEKEHEILSTMENAIKEEEFFIVVQPKIELQTERLVGGEVLIRWKKKDGTFVYPDEFIPLFEENEFITKLDHYVLVKTCEFIRDSNMTLPILSVNVSASTMLEPDFIQSGLDILNQYGVLPQQIEVELTESALDSDFKRISEKVRELKKAGFSLAVDDFGKGASSLARIKEIEMDVLKFDKEFIEDNSDNNKGKLILSNAIAMANDLGITSLAEGIETKEQQSLLIELGCEQGQGYYFDRPLSLHDYLQRVEANSQKEFDLVPKNKELHQYWNKFENLAYGIAVTTNDQFSTILKANDAFYNIIGYTKESLQTKHNNRFTTILVDNLYNLAKKYLDEKKYDFSYDLRVLKENGDMIWIHDVVKYDPERNLFFITILDITEQNKSFDKTISHKEYSLQKEIASHINNHVSDYIYVTDITTDEVLYINQNSKDLLGFKEDNDWLGQKYYQLVYGVDKPLYPEFYSNLTEDAFSVREYFNEHMQMQLQVKAKVITVNGMKVRLHIVTDVTAQHKKENDLALQGALLNCIEELYEYEDSNKTFISILNHIKNFYEGDSTYFFEIGENKQVLGNIYAVRKDKIKDYKKIFKALSPAEQGLLIRIFANTSQSYFTLAELLEYGLTPAIKEILVESNTQTLLIAPLRDENHGIVGFIFITNPRNNKIRTELIHLLSRFVAIYNQNEELRKFEKEALRAEEKSKVEILEYCAKELQIFENMDQKLTTILELLRFHYGADCAIMLDFSKDRTTYSVRCKVYNKNVGKIRNKNVV